MYIHACIHIHILTDTYSCTFMHTHTHTHTHIHTHTYTSTHACIQSSDFLFIQSRLQAQIEYAAQNKEISADIVVFERSVFSDKHIFGEFLIISYIHIYIYVYTYIHIC